MGLAHTVSKINGGFSRKSPVSHPYVFIAPAEGVSVGLFNSGSPRELSSPPLPDGGKFDDVLSFRYNTRV